MHNYYYIYIANSYCTYRYRYRYKYRYKYNNALTNNYLFFYIQLSSTVDH